MIGGYLSPAHLTTVPDGRCITSQIQKAARRAKDARVAGNDGFALADRVCEGGDGGNREGGGRGKREKPKRGECWVEKRRDEE